MRIPFSRPKSASIASAGPLSVGVPLEGTDTVPGLRALEQRAAADDIARLLGVVAANGAGFFVLVIAFKSVSLCYESSDRGSKGLRASLEGTIQCRCFFPSLSLTLTSPLNKKKLEGFAPGRKYARYRGPYLDQLTLESLKAEPKEWSEFFGVGGRRSGAARSWRNTKKEKTDDGGNSDSDNKPSSSSSSSSSSAPPPSWTLPTSVLALRERAEENLVAFLPNYLRSLAAIVVSLAALGGRPLSLVGLACLACFAFANARGMFGGPSVSETLARQQRLMLEQQQRAAAVAAGQAGPSGAPATPPEEQQTPPARAAATVFVYGVAAYTRAFAPLTRGIALGIALMALHACLRVAATERAAWGVASDRQRKSSYAVAGVPLRDVFFAAPKRTGASHKEQQQYDDPRRCLRELAAAVRALASAAAIGAKAGTAAAVDAGVAKVKALRQQLR